MFDEKYEYEGKFYKLDQITTIEEGLEMGVDVSVYANPDFDWEKMESIMLALINDINTDFLTHSKFNGRETEDIYSILIEAKREGINLDKYANLGLNYCELVAIENAIKHNLNIDDYLEKGYKSFHLKFITRCMIRNIDFSEYEPILKNLDVDEVRELLCYLKIKNNS